MISDTEWAIHYMESGSIPGTKWNVSRWEISKREIPVDPLVMARYLQNREPISTAPEWMIELLERMMSTLSTREKDAYELVRGRGYSYDQAGKLMKCTKDTVGGYLRRAEKKLQKEVRKEGCCCELR
jgi:RNA polymerase sigma-70 factor (ECF subfamily)